MFFLFFPISLSRYVISGLLKALLTGNQHPDLFVSFFGWFVDPYATHIAMEYIQHGDLGQYIADHGASAKAHREVGEITSQILEGLVVLHERDICHRDLKPQVRQMALYCPGFKANGYIEHLDRVTIPDLD